MRQVCVLALFCILAYLNSYGQSEMLSKPTPCNPLTDELLRERYEAMQNRSATKQAFDTVYVLMKDQQLSELEKLSDWAIQSGYSVTHHKDVDYDEQQVNFLDIGMYKPDLLFEDLSAFVAEVNAAKKQLNLDLFIHGMSIRMKPQ